MYKTKTETFVKTVKLVWTDMVLFAKPIIARLSWVFSKI